jgi:mono/diheme cytochrome c family protein
VYPKYHNSQLTYLNVVEVCVLATVVALSVPNLLDDSVVRAMAGPRGEQQESTPSRSVWDGVYTAQQAKRGEAIYGQECSNCHSADLTGGEAPALIGDSLLADWTGLTVADLFGRFLSMPADSPGRLSPAQYADLLAFVLSANKFPVGEKELDRDAVLLRHIRFDAQPPSK